MTSLQIFDSVVLGMTFLAEVMVALVIYWEIEQHRLGGFMDSFTKVYEGRADIYESFASLNTDDLETRRTLFSNLVQQDEDLRRKCDEQINHFDMMWYTQGRVGRRKLLKWFPGVVATMYVVLGKWAPVRAGRRGGFWGDRYFILFAEKSIVAVVERGCTIPITSRSGTVVISPSDFETMITEIRSLRWEHNFPSIRQRVTRILRHPWRVLSS